jgi:uncharacterized protein (DUF2252 family)
MKSQSAISAPRARLATLTQTRDRKMASSAHAFVRGSTIQFYKWLKDRGAQGIPQGPPVWICGDCHVGNLGPVADAKGNVHIQIRDLDQTVIGNPVHDLIRLALSLASASRGSDLPGVTTVHMLEQMMMGYRRGLTQHRTDSDPIAQKPECVRVVMRRSVHRTWRNLAKERLRDVKPRIPLGQRFWPLTAKEGHAIKALCTHDKVRDLVVMLKSRSNNAQIEVLDAAYWMKGCSSLGRLRYAVLLGVSGGKRESDQFCLLDIKEAIAAVAPRATHASMPRDNAKRVVEGARRLAPALGDRMVAAQLLGKSVFVRELMPQDLKVEIDQLTREEAVAAAGFLSCVVGQAHGRQMDSKTRKEFLNGVCARSSKRVDAPSWLWSSVVDLAAAHEAAYLEHCRDFAQRPNTK